jgi:hypothetical protein
MSMRSVGDAARMLAIGGLLAFAGCSDNDEGQGKPTGDSWTVYSNATDPELAKVVTTEGDEFHFFGTRTLAGEPVSVDAIRYTQLDGQEHHLMLNPGLGITGFQAANGVRFDFDPLGGGRYLVKAALGDGSTEVQFVFDPVGPVTVAPAEPLGGQVSQRHEPVRGTIRPLGSSACKSIPLVFDESSGIVRVQIERCGETPADDFPWVRLHVRDQGNSTDLGTFPMQHMGNGLYQTSIPVGQEVWSTWQSDCIEMAELLGYSCTAIDGLGPAGQILLCPQLSAALAASGIGAAITPQFFVACEALMAAQEVLCMTLNYGNNSGPSLAEMLCGLIPEDRSFSSMLELTPYIHAFPADIMGNTIQVEADQVGTFTIGFDIGSQPGISSLTLDPAAPPAGVDYLASSIVYCITPGTVVTMSVVGTDGYTDSWTEMVDESYPQAICRLSVPGAAAGVQDEVTIRITPSGSYPVVTRTSSLVFGGN